jgi:5'-nucleotidase
MKVLLTNDDGIEADGIQTLRRALVQVPGVELATVAPNGNRSAMARSITTRTPLWVDEVEFDDGTTGYATDGTPVDCVRFAWLGLIDFVPDLIVSGINHGVNLGDDITYSGTVAAALEGVVLGIPAIAVSQDSNGDAEFRPDDVFEFEHSAAFAARLVEELGHRHIPPGTLLNVNAPAGRPEGVRVCRPGKRIYRDRMELVEEADGRRRYRIYGEMPGFEEEQGTDFEAMGERRIAVTPLHFDLTDADGIDRLGGFDLDRLIAPAASEVE